MVDDVGLLRLGHAVKQRQGDAAVVGCVRAREVFRRQAVLFAIEAEHVHRMGGRARRDAGSGASRSIQALRAALMRGIEGGVVGLGLEQAGIALIAVLHAM